jgi:glutaredoxin-like protein NrdH
VTAPTISVTVFSKPNCVQCRYTKRELESKSLDYNEIDVTIDDGARKMLQDMGISELPAVSVEDGQR